MFLAPVARSAAERGEYGGRVQVAVEGVGRDAKSDAECEQKVVGRGGKAAVGTGV